MSNTDYNSFKIHLYSQEIKSYIHILREHICHPSCNQAKFPLASLVCRSSFRCRCRDLPRGTFVHRPTANNKPNEHSKFTALMGDHF